MSKCRVFTNHNNYARLDEAVESIMADENDDVEYDLVLLPPDPAIVSDEEEGNDDDLTNSTLPRDVPGTLEVVPRHPNHDISDWDESNDEPLSNIARPAKRSRNEVSSNQQRQQSEAPIWRKTLPIYSTVHNITDAIQNRQKHVVECLKNHSPVLLFEEMFDDDVMSLIVNNSLLYAGQNNRHNFEFNTSDLKRFLGILILSGYHELPSERSYWSLDEDLGVPLVANCMSRNRFTDIKRNLHFVDNLLAAGTIDKMFKVRPLCDLIQRNSCQWGVFHENLSVDESMIKYFGRHSAKQFIMGKPVRFGYKNWAGTSSDGYCYSFDIYCGKSAEASTDTLGARVVKSLLAKMPINASEHVVYFDNFFTNYQLLHDLRLQGYRATGTIRDNRTKKCPLVPVKTMKKQPRAEYDYRFDKKNEITIVRWKDNNVVTMGSNFDNVEPLGKVKRWCSVKKQKFDVNIPRLFVNYNRGMGGVDQMDQSISLYRVSLKGKKWWWVIFTYVLDMAISNAWRLHVLLSKTEEDVTYMDQLSFRRSIARAYLQQGKSKTRPPSSAVDGLDTKNNGHNPERIEKPLRCVICHNRVRWRCELCAKTLCVERPCFGEFHS
ncbi:hypothetical protein O0L34_g7996 [Tuta absoluta]|nr:hypothetical protein O0L34_g7996 [Tuta absoluta]